jgi:hypothetical protein
MVEQGRAQSNLDAAIQGQSPFEGAELVGWTIVAEWLTRDGEQKLARLNSKDASHWQVTGYLHEALFGEEDGWSGNGREAAAAR